MALFVNKSTVLRSYIKYWKKEGKDRENLSYMKRSSYKIKYFLQLFAFTFPLQQVCSRTEPVTSLSYYGHWFWAEVHHPVNSKCDHSQGKDMSGHPGHICIYSLFLPSVCVPLKVNPTHIPLKSPQWEKDKRKEGKDMGVGSKGKSADKRVQWLECMNWRGSVVMFVQWRGFFLEAQKKIAKTGGTA